MATKATDSKSTKTADTKAAVEDGAVKVEKIAKAVAKAPRKKAPMKAAAKKTDVKPARSVPKPDVRKPIKKASYDMQDQIKNAVEKSNTIMADYNEMAKGNLEAIVESGKVLSNGMQEMGREVMEDTRSAYEGLTADMQTLVAATSPTEMLQLQGELARKYFDQSIARGSKLTESWMKLANDTFAPVSNQMSVAMEKASKAA